MIQMEKVQTIKERTQNLIKKDRESLILSVKKKKQKECKCNSKENIKIFHN